MKNTTEESGAPRFIELPPPSLYDADDGGLGYDDIARDPERVLVVRTGPWGDIKPGDVVSILWGSDLEPIASHHYSEADNFSPHIRVEAKALSRYGEGSMPLAAEITLFDTGQKFRTASVPVLVKLSVPGGFDPEPETPHRNEALAAPKIVPKPLPDDLEGIHVEVAPYQNMSAGDRVTVQWHTGAVRHGPLLPSEVGKPLRVPIPKDVASSATGGEASVQYQIHDVVANWSQWSPPTLIEVPPGEGAPEAPWVFDTVRDEGQTLDLALLGAADVKVRVEGHSAKAGDNIGVMWEGVTATGKLVTYPCPLVRITRPGQTIDAHIPNRKVVSLAAGSASVRYVIFAPEAPVVTSRRRRLSIEGKAHSVLAPRLREASYGFVDPARTTDGAHVVIPTWDGIDHQDRCYLEWVGTTAGGQATFYHAALTGADVGPDDTLVFTVPGAEVLRLAEGSLRIRYAVSIRTPVRYEDGMRNEPLVHLESPWLELDVGKAAAPLSIDSSPVTLSGTLIRLEKRVTVPPEGTFVARMATGGVPPYRYTANSGAVEVDEATGRVVSLRNGTTIVTVTDSKGASASYPVTVSNVAHLVDLDTRLLWSSAAAEANKRGGRLPHVEEWDAMRAAYGGAPGHRDESCWSDTVASSVSRLAVFPSTGVREALRSAAGPGRAEPGDERWIPIGPKFGSAWTVALMNLNA